MKAAAAADFLMFVGSKYYATPEHFIAEALHQGVSKRMSSIPMNLVTGKSRVFLAHDRGGQERFCPKCQVAVQVLAPKGQKDQLGRKRETAALRCPQCLAMTGFCGGVIFGYFVPDKLEVIVDPKNLTDEQRAKYDAWRNQADVEYVGQSEVKVEKERGCGYRKPGGVYLVASVGVDQRSLAELANTDIPKQDWINGMLRVLQPWVPYGGKRFRGIKQIDLFDLAEIQKRGAR